jgi:hypothetical protein
MPSRDAIRRAERALESGEKGVRDEVGFSVIHDAYANRFFPGTSVQHTRLRYTLFLPWIYRHLISRGVGQNLERELAREELTLVRRLSMAEEQGVIARTIYPRPAKQPPSVIYWSALGTWGLLRHDENGTPSRAIMHRRIEAHAGATRKRQRTEFEAEEPYEPFYTLPDTPRQWEDVDRPLSFDLEPGELEYMTGKLLAVKKPGEMAPSLLSILVDSGLVPESMYSREITRLADSDDRRALRQAHCAAAMGAVGRAIYAALLENVCDTEDGRDSIGRMHREHLWGEVLPQYREQALQIDLDELRSDVPKMADTLLAVLRKTHQWLQGPMTDVTSLRDYYAASEQRRKGDRARLPSTGLARDRRHVWQPKDTKPAAPLHYRWPITRQFLMDLQ